MDLGSKHFLVVGASGALGQRIVRRLRDAGASVSLAGRDADRVATDDRLDILVAAGRIAADVVATHRTTPTPSHERTRQA